MDAAVPEVSDIEPAPEVDAACTDDAALTAAAENEAAVDMADEYPEVLSAADDTEPVSETAPTATTPAETEILSAAAQQEAAEDVCDGASDTQMAVIKEPDSDNTTPDLSGEIPDVPATTTPTFAAEPPKKEGYLARLKAKLVKTRNSLAGGVDGLFVKHSTIDDDLLEELEELLITADLGVDTAMDIVQAVAVKKNSDADQVKNVLKQEILKRLQYQPPKPKTSARPEVIMVVGVNGVGKTTTIGKLASKWATDGKQVMIGAGDTFRAAAVEQLEVWANRSGASIIKHKPETDPAAVAFDSVEAGLSRNMDKVIIDTAGRLHTNSNLMEELKKIKRSIGKKMPEAPHEIWLVLDATTGQNALSQAKLFDAALDLTGLVLTKLDGTAKGGIVVAIASELKIPICYIGIGEKVEDLQEFDPIQFVDALF